MAGILRAVPGLGKRGRVASTHGSDTRCRPGGPHFSAAFIRSGAFIRRARKCKRGFVRAFDRARVLVRNIA